MAKFKNEPVPAQVLKIVYGKLEDEINALAGVIPINSWEDVQKAVRSGIASKVFSIGDQLTCQKDGVNLVWDIIGIDHDTPADPQYTHSMTLQLHDCFQTQLQYDAPEAFYYAENGLAAGTYYFTIDDTCYQFTLSSAVPAGGQLILTYNNNVPSAISISATKGGEATGAIPVIIGNGGTEIATFNSISRVKKGSNNYKNSAIRQWLNSSAAAGSVWTPQNDFDRPPKWHTGESGTTKQAGFLTGMDADFLAVLGNVTKVTAKNTATDGGGYDTTAEKFFLLSRSEVYDGIEVSGVNEGEPYPYYSDNSSRIKYRDDTARYWWLRTPYAGNGCGVRRVLPTGGVDVTDTLYSLDVVPACNII